MTNGKTNKRYIVIFATAVIWAAVLLLSFFSALEIFPSVYAAAAEGAAPETPPLTYSYQDERPGFFAMLSAGYYVEGFTEEWFLNNSAPNKTDVNVTIPAEYSGDHGLHPVVAIADFEFAESTSTIFRVVEVDFSNAINLEYIGLHAFANSKITDVDLSKCTKLKEIMWGAFFESADLRTFKLPQVVSIYDGVFEGCDSLEYILTQNQNDYAEYAAMADMEAVAHLLTYETEVTFDYGDSQTVTQTKLFNLPLAYAKTDGEWQKTGGTLPEAGFAAGKFGIFANNADGSIITEETNATNTLYQITWITITKLEVVTNFPEGLSTDKSQNPNDLKKYLTVTAYGGDNEEYSRMITDYTLTFIDGNNDQMTVNASAIDMKTDFDAPITPINPKDTRYIWLIVGSATLLLAAVAFVVFIKRKKIVTQTITNIETVTVTETIEKEVIREVPVITEVSIVTEVPIIKKTLPKDLSEQERQVAELILRGNSRSKIAAKMKISEGTAGTYMSRVYTKAGVDGQKDFVAYFLSGEDKADRN